jgi:hypothetical protein
MGYHVPEGEKMWEFGFPGWGRLKFETVRYCYMSSGTRTRERVRFRSPTANAIYRTVLSSERTWYINKPATVLR